MIIFRHFSDKYTYCVLMNQGSKVWVINSNIKSLFRVFTVCLYIFRNEMLQITDIVLLRLKKYVPHPTKIRIKLFSSWKRLVIMVFMKSQHKQWFIKWDFFWLYINIPFLFAKLSVCNMPRISLMEHS